MSSDEVLTKMEKARIYYTNRRKYIDTKWEWINKTYGKESADEYKKINTDKNEKNIYNKIHGYLERGNYSDKEMDRITTSIILDERKEYEKRNNV